MPGNEDGPEAGQRGDFRVEFRRMIAADPLLAGLARCGYPDLPLQSTSVVSLATLVVAVLTRHLVLAAVIGLLVLAGHAGVVHLLAQQNERGGGLVLTLLRTGCVIAVVLLVGASLVGPTGSVHVIERVPRTVAQPATAADPPAAESPVDAPRDPGSLPLAP
jgi:hypothetical protein